MQFRLNEFNLYLPKRLNELPMTDFFTYFRDEPNLHLTDFTNLYFMEDKKLGSNPKSLQDLKKQLQVLTQQESLKILGGKINLDKDKWNTGCGGILPQ